MRNPLTQVSGPEFLVLFALLIALVAIVCWHRRKAQDRSRDLPPLKPSNPADPYEIAYMRAGPNELARVLIVKLIKTKYLRIRTQESKWWESYSVPKLIEHQPGHPDVADLTPIESAAFDWFATSRTASEVFRNATSLTEVLSPHVVRHEQSLRSRGLLTSEELKDKSQTRIALGIAVMMTVGLARLFIGISRDRPVGFLILMGIAGVFIVARAGKPGRLSDRGRDYLARARDHWSSLRDSRFVQDWDPALAAGLFGFGVLAGTEMSPVKDMFRRSEGGTFTAAGGVGGACGGWSDGGSGGAGSDGGGGGGCGGGCGGCGGG